MNQTLSLKLPLQFFAEGEPETPTADGNGAEVPETEPKPQTFDDILGNKEYQSEFDRRVNKALETARAKWDAETQEKLTEAKKLEKMNAEQKAAYAREQQEKQLTEREAAITRRELTATAKETLVGKGLPTELADILDYTNADKCSASIEAVSKAFSTAVEKATNDKLRGTPPKSSGGGNETKDPFLIGLGV